MFGDCAPLHTAAISPFTLIIGMGTIHTTLHIYRAVMLRGYIYTAPLVHLDANVNLQLLNLLLITTMLRHSATSTDSQTSVGSTKHFQQ